MKKLLVKISIVSLIIIFGNASADEDENDLIINYKALNIWDHVTNQKWMQLVFEKKSNRLYFRLPMNYRGNSAEEAEEKENLALTLLKTEVQRIIERPNNEIKMGDTKYTICFKGGGYPVWAPFEETGYSRKYECSLSYRCLMFTEKVLVRGKKIWFWGSKEKGAFGKVYQDIKK